MLIAKFLKMVTLILIIAVLLPVYSKAQDASQSSKLESYRQEINKYRQKLADQKKKELSTLDLLQEIEREINLMHKFSRQLRNEELQLRQGILDSNEELLGLQDEFNIQKAVFAHQVVNIYKHRKLGDLEILLTSKSFNQVFVWLKYFQKITEADKRRLNSLLEKKQEIEQSNRLRKIKLDAHEKIIAEKENEELRLQKKKKDRENLLSTIQNDKKLYAQKIAEYTRAAKEIERLVKENVLSTPTGRSFATIKGNLAWPVDGRIINRFGPVKNPITNIYYPNNGINIQASIGDDVLAVYPGIVSAITWLRGLGNVIMIRHVGDFTTVYAHLSEILVVYGQDIFAGDLIGRVGESDSGPMLHFEIYKDDKAVNPEQWLSKRKRIASR